MTNPAMKNAEWYVLAVLARGEQQGSSLTRKAGHKNYQLALKKGSTQTERVTEDTVQTLRALGFLKSRIGVTVNDLLLSDAGRVAIAAEQAKAS